MHGSVCRAVVRACARGKHGGGGLGERGGEAGVEGEVAHEGPRVLEERQRDEDIVQADSQHHEGREEVNERNVLPVLGCRIQQPRNRERDLHEIHNCS